jgi:tRNA A-37 threonylcarbamoyl transferase component Bud32
VSFIFAFIILKMKRKLTIKDLMVDEGDGGGEVSKKVDLKMFHFELGRNLKHNYASVPISAFRKFRVKDRVLGKGSFATVFLAENPQEDGSVNQPVALKIQFNDEQFREEQKVTRKMSKWGLGPKLIDSWITDGYGFIALEYWDGSMLDLNLDKLPDTLTAKLRSLIEEMHRIGYVHADILPKNVLVRVDQAGIPYNVTLCDFGLAQYVEDFQLTPDGNVEEDGIRRGFMSTLYNYHNLPDNCSHFYFEERRIRYFHCIKDPRHLDYGLLYFLEKGA